MRKWREFWPSREPAKVKDAGALPRYDQCELPVSETVLSFALGAVLLGAVAMVFYSNMLVALVFAAGGAFFPSLRRRMIQKARKAQLQLQFKQLLSSLSSSLAAGKSLESAFHEAADDLRLLYPDPGTYILRELDILHRRTQNGESMEKALMSLAVRTDLDDIRQLAEVIHVCKRSGGNLIQVVRRTATIIQDKLEIQQEIRIGLAQKRFESHVLSLAPLVMIGVLAFTTPDYMEPLYNKPQGIVVMTAALGAFAGSFLIIRKLMNITV